MYNCQIFQGRRLLFIKLVILIPLLFFSCIGLAQQSGIHGFIKDKKTGEPVSFSHIYIANTIKGTTSDSNGKFVLNNIPSGQFTLVCSVVGYESFTQDVNLSPGEKMELIIELNAASYILNEVELVDKEDKKWKKQFEEFARELLGNTPNAAYCEIVNPWIVDFVKFKRKSIIEVQVNQPLIIKNKVLGYEISFLLTQFKKDHDHLFYIGYPSFNVIDTSDSIQLIDYGKNRLETYKGSLKHFFFALVNNRLKDEGFLLYRISKGHEDIMNQSLKEAEYNDYFNPLDVTDIVSDKDPWGNFIICTSDMLEIIYTDKKWKESWYYDAPYQVSRILLSDNLLVNQNGYVFNPYSYIVYGFLSEERLANMLPFEYNAETVNNLDPQN